MKIAFISDIHLEFRRIISRPIKADVLVLAGDIGTGTLGIEWALDISKKHPEMLIIYVPGNHEFYGVDELLPFIEKLKTLVLGTNIKVMNNDFIDINGIRFIGSILWSDFNLFGNQPLGMYDVAVSLNDYNYIGWQRNINKVQQITPDNILNEFLKSKEFIFKNLSDTLTNVVITHHAPSIKSVRKEILFERSTAGYASNLDYQILASNIKLWIHGHVHNELDYLIGETRVVGRMTGYENNIAKPKIIEL